MSTLRRPSTRTVSPNETTPELEQAIRQRAYELYEQRGRETGHDLDDWLRAEAELTRQRGKTIAA